MSLVLRIGETASEKTEWKSDTSILTIAAAASGNIGSLKVAVTAQIRAGTTTTALSYDAPSARSVRIAGLRVATVDFEIYCPKKYNSIVDMFSNVPLPTLPPVLDCDSASRKILRTTLMKFVRNFRIPARILIIKLIKQKTIVLGYTPLLKICPVYP